MDISTPTLRSLQIQHDIKDSSKNACTHAACTCAHAHTHTRTHTNMNLKAVGLEKRSAQRDEGKEGKCFTQKVVSKERPVVSHQIRVVFHQEFTCTALLLLHSLYIHFFYYCL